MPAHPFLSVAAVVASFGIACTSTPSESPRGSEPPPTEFELNEMSAAQLQEGMAAGRYTSRRLVELYLQRIAQIDAAGPRLRAVIETNPDAVAIADALDGERMRTHRGARGAAARHPRLHQGQHRHATGCRRPQARSRCKARDRRAMRSSSNGCAPRAPYPRQGEPHRIGKLRSTAVLERVERPGAPGATPTRSIASRRVRARRRGRGRRGLAPSRWAPRRTGRSSVPLGLRDRGFQADRRAVSRAGIIPIAHRQDTAGPMARSVADAADTARRHDRLRAARIRRRRWRSDGRDAAGLRALPGPGRALRRAHRRRALALRSVSRRARGRCSRRPSPPSRRRARRVAERVDLPNAAPFQAGEFRGAPVRVQGGAERLSRRCDPARRVTSLAELIAFNLARTPPRSCRSSARSSSCRAEAKGPLTVAGIPGGALQLCRRLARRTGHRRRDDHASAGCTRGADVGARLADRFA